MSDEAVTHVAGSTFPQTPEEFDDDPRVSYSKLDQKWILENDDGNEFEFDSALKRWIPSVRVLTCSPGQGQRLSCLGGGAVRSSESDAWQSRGQVSD